MFLRRGSSLLKMKLQMKVQKSFWSFELFKNFKFVAIRNFWQRVVWFQQKWEMASNFLLEISGGNNIQISENFECQGHILHFDWVQLIQNSWFWRTAKFSKWNIGASLCAKMSELLNFVNMAHFGATQNVAFRSCKFNFDISWL